MSYNGSGVYSLYTVGNPVITGTTISSTWANNTLSDIATALNLCVLKDGQQIITANIPMATYKFTGLGAGSARTDSAAISNIQDGTGVYVSTVGGTADAITLTPAPAITAYAAGQAWRWIASGANTTNVTVAISGLAARALTKRGSTALTAGDIPSGAMVYAVDDGTRLQLTGWVSLGANSFKGAQDFARATVASHATTADIWGALGNQIDWTGTATTTAFPNAPQAGAERVLICAGACSFTAGANMLIDGVSSGSTVTCAANDQVIVRAVSTTQFKLSRVKYDGTAQVSSIPAFSTATVSELAYIFNGGL